MKIGNLEINDKAALAPLAGVADRAFRELCRGYGAAYTVCEMASAKGISLGDKKSAELLAISEAERPAGSQIFGNARHRKRRQIYRHSPQRRYIQIFLKQRQL